MSICQPWWAGWITGPPAARETRFCPLAPTNWGCVCRYSTADGGKPAARKANRNIARRGSAPMNCGNRSRWKFASHWTACIPPRTRSRSEEGLQLAESELTQARRRYEAGVTSSLEVTDAQTRLERAQDNRITALFNYNVARIDLGHATGDTRRMIQ